MTAKYGTPYFSNYINSDMEPSDVRSMCPLYAKEKVLVLDDYSKEFHLSKIENLYNGNKKEKEYYILHNGKVKKAALHKFDNLDFYELTLANNHKVKLSGNHLNLTLKNGILKTEDLTTEDYLPFNNSIYEGIGLTYDDGLIIGAYLGDGSLKDDYTVVYSLNDNTKQLLASKLCEIAVLKFGAKVNVNQVGEHCINYNFTSKTLRAFIEEYVSGSKRDKEINPKVINHSVDFREGIVKGYLETDGSNKDRIYTSSEKMVETFIPVLSSLGIVTNISVDERKSDVTFSDNPVYVIKLYSPSVNSRKNIFVKEDGYTWFKIKEIKKMKNAGIGYCFEVLNDEEPYFMMPNGLVTHNCRLRLDLRELRKKSGGFFGSGESTGSIGVVTINMPRIAYLSVDENDFYKKLDNLMDISARSLKIKRNVITKLFNEGLYPYTKRYLDSLDNHFSTIGLIGMNEVGLNANWLKADLTNEKVQKFTKEVLTHMRERLSDYQEKYGDLYNLEATPAESTTYRLAKKDKELYPDIKTAGHEGDTPYYTNSSHLPVDYTADIFDALDIQDELQTLYTSGTVFHAFLGEKLPDWKAAASLIKTIADNYRLPYYTMSPTYSVCMEHGYLAGEQRICPHCGKPTEVYSRITGYYRPVKNWNDGKAQEYLNRKTYDIANSRKRNECNSCKIDITSEETSAETKVDLPMLFGTKVCPNCKIAKEYLNNAGINYIWIDAEENPELTRQYGVMQAPTLIVPDNGSYKKYVNASNIKAFTQK